MARGLRSKDEPKYCPLHEGLSGLPGNEVSILSHPIKHLGNNAHLMPFFLSFSLDSLATAELNITVALLFRPGGPKMSVFETDESDILSVRDFVLGLPKPDSRGVRVVVH